MSNLYPVSLVSVGVKVSLSLLSSCELGRASTKHPQHEYPATHFSHVTIVVLKVT